MPGPRCPHLPMPNIVCRTNLWKKWVQLEVSIKHMLVITQLLVTMIIIMTIIHIHIDVYIFVEEMGTVGSLYNFFSARAALLAPRRIASFLILGHEHTLPEFDEHCSNTHILESSEPDRRPQHHLCHNSPSYVISCHIILRPISQLRVSLLRLVDSILPGNSIWAWELHPLKSRLRLSQTL